MYTICREHLTTCIRLSAASAFQKNPFAARNPYVRRLKVTSSSEARGAMSKAKQPVSNVLPEPTSSHLAVAEDMLKFINTAWTQFHAVGAFSPGLTLSLLHCCK